MDNQRDLNEIFMEVLDEKLGLGEAGSKHPNSQTMKAHGWYSNPHPGGYRWKHDDHEGHSVFTSRTRSNMSWSHDDESDQKGSGTVGSSNGPEKDLGAHLAKFHSKKVNEDVSDDSANMNDERRDLSDHFMKKFKDQLRIYENSEVSMDHDEDVDEAKYEFSDKALHTTSDNKDTVYVPDKDDPEARDSEDRTMKQAKAYTELGMVKSADRRYREKNNEVKERTNDDKWGDTNEGKRESDLSNDYGYHDVHKQLVDKGHDYVGSYKDGDGPDFHRYDKDGKSQFIDNSGRPHKPSKDFFQESVDLDFAELVIEKTLPYVGRSN